MILKNATLFRLFFGICAVVVAATVIVMFGRYWNPYVRFSRRALEVTAVVEAIYDFHGMNDLWPENLEELIPLYIGAKPAQWEYVWPGYSVVDGPVLKLHGPMHMTLEYVFPVSNEDDDVGWRTRCEGDRLPVDVVQHIPNVNAISAKQRKRNAIRVISERIASEPSQREHTDEYRRRLAGDDE